MVSIRVWRNSNLAGKQADRQTNVHVHSNVVSVRLILQKLRFDVHWFACLPAK